MAVTRQELIEKAANALDEAATFAQGVEGDDYVIVRLQIAQSYISLAREMPTLNQEP